MRICSITLAIAGNPPLNLGVLHVFFWRKGFQLKPYLKLFLRIFSLISNWKIECQVFHRNFRRGQQSMRGLCLDHQLFAVLFVHAWQVTWCRCIRRQILPYFTITSFHSFEVVGPSWPEMWPCKWSLPLRFVRICCENKLKCERVKKYPMSKKNKKSKKNIACSRYDICSG